LPATEVGTGFRRGSRARTPDGSHPDRPANVRQYVHRGVPVVCHDYQMLLRVQPSGDGVQCDGPPDSGYD
jgi:hypothetical protein